MQNIEIGEHLVIGAGSLINKNIGNLSVYYGVQMKFIRARKTGENYLK
jgi:acetyltransferase-like isoleucine patch superfamily enzyme